MWPAMDLFSDFGLSLFNTFQISLIKIKNKGKYLLRSLEEPLLHNL
jgi:hypothetical protein